MLKVKIVSSSDLASLEKSINEFIEGLSTAWAEEIKPMDYCTVLIQYNQE